MESAGRGAAMNLPVEASHAAIPADPYAQWWDYDQQIARALCAGLPLPPIGVYGPVLDMGERAYISGQSTYSRYAPGDNSYTALNAMILARPPLTVGALAAQGMINHQRKTAAQRDAADAWRNTRETHIIVTSDRLLTNSPSGWLNFWHETDRRRVLRRSQSMDDGDRLRRPPVPAGAAHRRMRTSGRRPNRTAPVRRPMECRPPLSAPTRMTWEAHRSTHSVNTPARGP
jgi:hypothetical protein